MRGPRLVGQVYLVGPYFVGGVNGGPYTVTGECGGLVQVNFTGYLENNGAAGTWTVSYNLRVDGVDLPVFCSWTSSSPGFDGSSCATSRYINLPRGHHSFKLMAGGTDATIGVYRGLLQVVEFS